MSKRFKNALALLLSASLIFGSNGTAVLADTWADDMPAASSSAEISGESSGKETDDPAAVTSVPENGQEEKDEPSPEVSDETKQEDAGAAPSETVTPQPFEAGKTEYTFDSSELKAVVRLSDSSALSDRAELKVTKPAKGTEEYKAGMKALLAQADAGSTYSEDDTLLYDISFTEDGRSVEPAAGEVSVRLSFKNRQLEELLLTGNTKSGIAREASGTAASYLEVKHLRKTGADGSELKVENVRGLSSQPEQEQVSFSVDSFSVFALHRTEQGEAASEEVVTGSGITADVAFCAEDGTAVSGLKIPQNRFCLMYTNGSGYQAQVVNSEGKYTVSSLQEFDSSWPWEYRRDTALKAGTYSFHLYRIKDGTDFACDGKNAKTLCDDTGLREELTEGSTVTVDGKDYIVRIEGLEKEAFWSSQMVVNYPATSSFSVRFVEKEAESGLTLALSFDEVPSFSGTENCAVFVEADVIDETGQKRKAYYIKALSELTKKETKIAIGKGDWKNSNGSAAQKVSYTGGEVKATVVKTDAAELNIPDVQSRQAHVVRVCENGLAGAYRVNYGVVKKESKARKSEKQRILPVSFHKVTATNDYDYLGIVGPGYLYGIVADTYRQIHEIQSNFAANHYYPGGNEIQPNLAGTDGGLVAVAHVEDGNAVRIARNTAGTLVVYIDDTQTSLVRDESASQMGVTIGMKRSTISANMVNPSLDHCAQISAALAGHEATIEPDENAKSVDARAFDDNATIYVHADNLAGLRNAGFTIRKKPGQMIVFNFNNSSPVLHQFAVEEYDGDGNLIRRVSSTETHAVGDPHNAELNEAICQKIVWNIANGNLSLAGSSAGIYLVPNGDIVSKESSTGWLLGGRGHSIETEQEWHYVYAENPQVDRAVLQAFKTVDGTPARNYQKFVFVLEKYDPHAGAWEEIGRSENSGSVVNFEVSALSDNYNAYRIREIAQAETTEGVYDMDAGALYARVNYFVVRSTSGQNQVAIAGAPEYFKTFRESAFDAKTGGGFEGEIEDPSDAPFANRTKPASLTLEKRVTDGYPSTQTFTFAVTLRRPVRDDDGNATGTYENVSGDFDTDRNTKVTFNGGRAVVKLRAGESITVEGLRYGDLYTVEETDLPAGYQLADGQEAKVGGTVGSGNKNGGAVVFSNSYRAEGYAVINGRKDLDGRDFKKGDRATFEIAAKTEKNAYAPLPSPATVTVRPEGGRSAAFSFGKIRYTQADLGGGSEKTFYYNVYEKDFSMDGTSKDTSVKEAAVTVRDNGKGQLETTVRMDGTQNTFTNRYRAEGSTEISGEKMIENRAFKKGDSMTFTLLPENPDRTKQPMPESDTVTVTPNGGHTAVFGFGTLHFTSEMLEGAAEKDFRYTITETAQMDGVTSDAGGHTLTVHVTDNLDGTLRIEKTYTNTTAQAVTDKAAFVNIYHADGVIRMTGTKTIAGRDFRGGDAWTFRVSCSDGSAPMPEKREVTIRPSGGNTAVLDFGEIRYSLADAGKTYVYTVEEYGRVPGVTNAGAQTMTVTVADGGSGRLDISRKFSGGAGLAFVNVYDAAGQTSADGVKILEMRDFMPGDLFAFEIHADASNPDAPMPEKTRVELRPDGGQSAGFTFGVIRYTLADLKGEEQRTFRYSFTETAQLARVKNDTGVHELTVSVRDQHDGTLKIEKTYYNSSDLQKTNQTQFINRYEASGSTTLSGTKMLAGRSFCPGDSFTFRLTGDGPLPEVTEKTITPTEGNAADFSFGPIRYTTDDLLVDGKRLTQRTFTYEVKEEAAVRGVTNDAGSHKAVVTVSDRRHDGTLEVTALYTNTDGKKESGKKDRFVFTNTYDASGETSLFGVKRIENREFRAGDAWTFTLSSPDPEAPLPEEKEVTISPKSGKSREFGFGKIRYHLSDLKGDVRRSFVYVITEKGNVAGVQNDTGAHTVTVTVTDQHDGTLRAVPVYSDPEGKAAFTNVYEAGGEFTLSGTKMLAGRSFRPGDAWTFRVKAREADAPMPEKREVTISPAKGGTIETFSFGKIRFQDSIFRDIPASEDGSRTRSFVYEVSESGSVDGVTNDPKEKHTVTVTVRDDGKGQLTAGAKYSDGDALLFVNTYDAEGSVTLGGSKKMEGRMFRPGDSWTFTLTADDADAPMPEKKEVTISPKEGDLAGFTFGTVKYRLADLGGKEKASFTYTVRESGDVKGVQNDREDHKIVVEVRDSGNGKLEVNASCGRNGEGLVFTNTYRAFGRTVIRGEKAIDHRDFHSGDYAEFEISAAASNPDAPLPEEKTATIRPVSGRSREIVFGEIRYTLEDLKVTNADGSSSYAESREFVYEIRESAADMTGTTADSHIAKVAVSVTDRHDGTLEVQNRYEGGRLLFVNRYRAQGSVSVGGRKNMEGRAFRKGDAWTFTISAEETDAPLPKQKSVTIHPVSGNTESFSFGEISYTLEDLKGKESASFVYTVKESGNVKGVSNDPAAKTIVVTVRDRKDGTLDVRAAYGGGALYFTNIYGAKGQTGIYGTKLLEGREFRKGDAWTFRVKADDAEAPMPERTEITIRPDEGKAAELDFGAICYTLADAGKTYVYTVSESGRVDGVQNDDARHTVAVSIRDDGEGGLRIAQKYSDGDALKFTNVYDAKGSVQIRGRKTIEGRNFRPGDAWTFTVSAEEADAPLPAKREVVLAPDDGTQKSFVFPEISYRLSDLGGEDEKTFTYRIAESGEVDGVTNDIARTVTVTVRDGHDGTLITSADYGRRAGGAAAAEAEFVNRYQASGRVKLRGRKIFDGEKGAGEPMEEGRFTFTVKENGRTVAKGKNLADGRISFTEIAYADLGAVGRHTYEIHEDVPDGAKIFTYELNGRTHTAAYCDDVVYDLHTAEVTVTVSDRGDGTLAAEFGGDGQTPVFENQSVHEVVYARFTKLDQNKKPLEGAHLQILNADGTVAKAYDADGNDGGELCDWISSAGESRRFLLRDLDVTDDEGTVYYLHEEDAPNGKARAEDVRFTVRTAMHVSADGTQYEQTDYYDEDGSRITDSTLGITMTDLTETKFEKRAADTKELLAGAVLVITDRDGNPVRNAKGEEILPWTTGEKNAYSGDGSAAVIEGLADGEYCLCERKAPEGYAIAKPLKFVIEDGKVRGNEAQDAYTVTLYDEKIENPVPTVTKKPSETVSKMPSARPSQAPSGTGAVQTGDNTPLARLLLMFTLAAAGLVLCLLVRRRQQNTADA